MAFFQVYHSPLGELFLTADAQGLTGAAFAGQKHFAPVQGEQGDLPVLEQAAQWLDCYFSGREPEVLPPMHLKGTAFQQAVWEILKTIPYGETTTYGAIAARLGRMSAQAVGGAVGRNPISIFVPCHRVIGSGGNLTGYAGGIDRKIALLKLEGAWRPEFFVPSRGTAL